MSGAAPVGQSSRPLPRAVPRLSDMLDSDVRSALHTALEREHAEERASTLFVDELGLCNEVRVDVAVVNGALSGFELKSARDTLTRLPKQVEVYSKVLDFATLVVAENHAEKAAALLPTWWGLTVACVREQQVVLLQDRPAQMNPSIDPHYVVQLLWKQETVDALARMGLDRGVRSAPRQAAWDRLASSCDLTGLRLVVREALKSRRQWRESSGRTHRPTSAPREGTMTSFLQRRMR